MMTLFRRLMGYYGEDFMCYMTPEEFIGTSRNPSLTLSSPSRPYLPRRVRIRRSPCDLASESRDGMNNFCEICEIPITLALKGVKQVLTDWSQRFAPESGISPHPLAMAHQRCGSSH